MHQDYQLTAMDADTVKDDVIGTSNKFKVSQLLISLTEEPIFKKFFLFNDQECRNVGNITVKISWVRKLGDNDIVGASLDIPTIEKGKAQSILKEVNSLDISPKLFKLALNEWNDNDGKQTITMNEACHGLI